MVIGAATRLERKPARMAGGHTRSPLCAWGSNATSPWRVVPRRPLLRSGRQLRRAIERAGFEPAPSGRIAQETLNVCVVRVRERPSAATSPIVRRLPRASAGTRKKQRAIEFAHTSRMFLYRSPPVHTLQWIEPGAGVNSTRATSSNGCAACGGRGDIEITSMRTSRGALRAGNASAVAAANSAAPNAASRPIMRSRITPSGSSFQP